jgi:hypothetical protein
MALTRAQVEAELISRRMRWIREVGLDYSTVDGSNTDLVSAIGYGIRRAGGSLVLLGAVTDTDVQTVASGDLEKLLDYADLRLCENILGHLEMVDTSGLPASENKDQLGKRIKEAIERLEERIEREYPSASSGYSATSYSLTRVDGYSDDIAYDEV